MYTAGSARIHVLLLVILIAGVSSAHLNHAHSVSSQSKSFLVSSSASLKTSWEATEVVQHRSSAETSHRSVLSSVLRNRLDQIPVGARKWVDAALSVYGLLTAVVFTIPLLMWLFGATRVAIICVFYLGLYMAWAMLTYATRDMPHNAGILVLNSLLIKFVLSVILWRLWEGTSFCQLPCVAWSARSTLFQHIVPGSLYALSDIIRVNALRATDASTFAILFNSRMLFLAFLWQWVMNRKLYLIHWMSLLAVLAGCFLKELPHVDSQHGDKRDWAYAEIALLGVITCIATVWNEMLLQKRAEVGVSLQNMAMYVWGAICILCVQIMWMFLSPAHLISPFKAASWQAIWGQPLVLLASFIMAVYGICTAYFLRYLSNITREVALGAFAPLLSVVMDMILFELTMGYIEYAGLVLVLVGVILFAFQPVLAIDATDADGKPLPMPEVPGVVSTARWSARSARPIGWAEAGPKQPIGSPFNSPRMSDIGPGQFNSPRVSDLEPDEGGAEVGLSADSDMIIVSPREYKPAQLSQS